MNLKIGLTKLTGKKSEISFAQVINVLGFWLVLKRCRCKCFPKERTSTSTSVIRTWTTRHGWPEVSECKRCSFRRSFQCQTKRRSNGNPSGSTD